MESDPSGKDIAELGSKVDAGKSKVYTLFMQYFPRAIQEVAKVSGAGTAKGYAPGSWKFVENGIDRYSDAMMRHILDEMTNEISVEGGVEVLHAAQVAWNALARLELL
jgi:ABC-type Zn uptake system ZnuABC Zn-binding protein ZnuA